MSRSPTTKTAKRAYIYVKVFGDPARPIPRSSIYQPQRAQASPSAVGPDIMTGTSGAGKQKDSGYPVRIATRPGYLDDTDMTVPIFG
jgi:hypothetical protein